MCSLVFWGKWVDVVIAYVFRWFLSEAELTESIYSWVDHVVPEGWYETQNQTVEVLEWKVWSFIKSSNDLIWSESLIMVIGMSLDSEH